MPRLTAQTLYGIWAALTMPWDENYRFDENTYAENIKRLIAAKVHGIYTTGSTGEFYAIDYDEFRRMVDIQAELCGSANMPLQIGCCSDCTSKTIRLIEYAAGKKNVGAVQVTIPYWMELGDREVIQFFKDLYATCPDMPLVHYNVPRAKRFLLAPDYRKILDVAPNLIGVKFAGASGHFSQLQDALLSTPQIAYFVGENLLVSAMQLGAKGSYSSLALVSPPYVIEMYNLAKAHYWDQAIKMQQYISKFFADAFAFIQKHDEFIIDPLFDKSLAVASGFLLGHHRCRKPYISWKDSTISAFRDWLKTNYPEFIQPQTS